MAYQRDITHAINTINSTPAEGILAAFQNGGKSPLGVQVASLDQGAVMPKLQRDGVERTPQEQFKIDVAKQQIDTAISFLKSRAPELNNKAMDEINDLVALRSQLDSNMNANELARVVAGVDSKVGGAVAGAAAQVNNQRITEEKFKSDYQQHVKSSMMDHAKAHDAIMNHAQAADEKSMGKVAALDPEVLKAAPVLKMGDRVDQTGEEVNKARAKLDGAIQSGDPKAMAEAKVELDGATVTHLGARTGRGYAIGTLAERPEARKEGVDMAERNKAQAIAVISSTMKIPPSVANQLIEKLGIDAETARDPKSFMRFMVENEGQVRQLIEKGEIDISGMDVTKLSGLRERFEKEAGSARDLAITGLRDKLRAKAEKDGVEPEAIPEYVDNGVRTFLETEDGRRLTASTTITDDELRDGVLKGFQSKLLELNGMKRELQGMDANDPRREALLKRFNEKAADIMTSAYAKSDEGQAKADRTIENTRNILQEGDPDKLTTDGKAVGENSKDVGAKRAVVLKGSDVKIVDEIKAKHSKEGEGTTTNGDGKEVKAAPKDATAGTEIEAKKAADEKREAPAGGQAK